MARFHHGGGPSAFYLFLCLAKLGLQNLYRVVYFVVITYVLVVILWV